MDESCARHFSASEIPRSWDATDLVAFFREQRWSQIQQLSKRKGTWFFKALSPSEDHATSSWRYELEDDSSWCIQVSVSTGPRNRPEVTSLRQPRPKQVTETRSPQNPEQQQMEIDDQALDAEEPVAPAASDTEASRSAGRRVSLDRSRSPARTIPEPVDPSEAQKAGWRSRDLGGVGDCFFRSVAEALAHQESPLTGLTEAEAIKRGATWRAASVGHARKHSSFFRDLRATQEEYDQWLYDAPCLQTQGRGQIDSGMRPKNWGPY